MTRSSDLRRRLVEIMERNGSLRTPAIRAAFLSVARETFVPQVAAAEGLDRVYADDALVTRKRDGMPTSSSSQPTIMVLMLEALRLRAGHRVLEIGLGTGYNAALLRTIVGDGGAVTSVDIAPEVLAEAVAALGIARVHIEPILGDGADGYAAGAPYDRIIATASTDHIPRAWWEQLAPDGILVAPLRFGAMQIVVVLARTPCGFVATEVIPGGFMPMRPDADAPSSPGVAVTVETNLGDGTTSSLAVSGPGLATLSDDARAAAVGHLLAAPRDRLPAPAGPVRALVWQMVMATPTDRQIVVYEPDAGTRCGTVGPDGSAALIRIGHYEQEADVANIELYGPDNVIGAQLVAAVHGWVDAGGPDLDRLGVVITYDDLGDDPPQWTMVASDVHGQRCYLGWRPC